MAISTVLLCFVGVWAAQTLNLKFTGIINPDIICKIEVKTPSAQNHITLFDNYTSQDPADFLDNQNRLKNFTTTLDGTVANELEFKLTNYTPTKHIRLSIQDILIDGNAFTTENLLTNHTSVTAEKFSGTADSKSFTLSLSANKNGQFTINLSLLVEEVYMVETSGNGLANSGKFFFAEDETPQIPLSASVSYQLPQSVTFSKIVDGESVVFVENTTYTRTNNITGTAGFALADLKENVSILCKCDRVFLIEKSTSASLFENGQEVDDNIVAPFDNTTTYLPNNGHYTYNANFSQVIQGEDFKEYPYYINLGEYPQTRVSPELASTLSTALAQNQLTALTNYSQNIGTLSSTIFWYEYQGEKYAYSTSLLYGSKTTTTEWFKIEPIVWIVLEAQSKGETVDLNTLYYDETQKMFYVDALCGKAFTGSLVLMSAYTIDAYAFNPTTNASARFDQSHIKLFLQETIGLAPTMDGNSTLRKMLYDYSQTNNYIPSTVLQTYSQNALGNAASKTSIFADLFLLGGNTNADETFHASKYFNYAPEKDKSIQTTSLAVTSPTDYAIAHYIETSASESTSNLVNAYNNPNNLASPRGWGIGTTPSTTYTCTYWTRSAYNSGSATTAMAQVINTRGSIKATHIADKQIGVRPCMVFDIEFYYNHTYQYITTPL
ncbi:MAG: hypothetical protein IJF22_02710 [Clostridia bacterium]|nr:hypothetical protein [Clostridia bacterium]